MAWLDRDRTPALFAIATSVVSGLISFVIARVMTDASRNALVLWVAAVAGAIALVSLLGIRAIRRERTPPRRAFVILSAFQQAYYIAEFVRQLNDAMDRVGIDLVLKVPVRNNDANAQALLLRRVVERRREYMGGVVFAGAVRVLRDDLADFCRKSRLPVVFTDLEPFREHEYPAKSVYVGYDTAQLGERAGRWLVSHLRGVDDPLVLIVASHEHESRQLECARVLRRELPNVRVDIEDTCAFERTRARDAVLRYVADLPSGRCLHAVFSTDDEMGLGVLEALETASPHTGSTVVIGIDGVLEARALIDKGDSPFAASVVQDPQQLALSVVEALVKCSRGQPVPTRTILPASLYENVRRRSLRG